MSTNARTAPAISPNVELINGQLVTTSMDVAACFGKRHDDVLRRIRALDLPSEFNARNFAVVDYIDAKGESRPAYRMTRDGFTFLVMGFTGQRATRFKIAYIEQFNAMERALTGQGPALNHHNPKALSPCPLDHHRGELAALLRHLSDRPVEEHEDPVSVILELLRRDGWPVGNIIAAHQARRDHFAALKSAVVNAHQTLRRVATGRLIG